MLLLIIGILISIYLGGSMVLSVSIFSLITVSVLALEFLLRNKIELNISRSLNLLILLMIIAFGWLRTDLIPKNSLTSTEEILKMSDWEEIQAQGVVVNTSRNAEGKFRADLRVSKVRFESGAESEEQFITRILLDSEEANIGDEVNFKATVIPVSEKRNPHQFDYKKYLAERGIHTQLRVDELISVTTNDSRLSWSWWREKAIRLVELNFDNETAPIAKALLLGYKQDLEGESRQAFARAGLSHIMAVSGLHVGFVVAPFWFLIPFFWSRKYGRQIGFVVLLLVLWGYAGLTGFSASVMRASVTAMFLTWGKLFNKSPNSINLTSAAAVVLLILNPMDLFSVGFQLSFLAVYIILLVLPVIQHQLPYWLRLKWYAKPLMVVIVSVVVQLGLYPVQVYYFGEVSLISPVANALFVPFLGIVVPLSLVALAISSVVPGIGYILNYPSLEFLTLLNDFVQVSSNWNWAWMEVSLLTILLFPFWAALIFTIGSWRVPKLRWKWMIISGVLFSLIQIQAIAQKINDPPLRVVVFDVGQGDGALLQTPNGRNILIDAGIWSPGSNSGQSIILPHLKAEGIQRLDAVILSHPHADHIGGILDLIENVEIGVIYNSGYEYSSNLYRLYLSLANESGIQVQSVKSGDILELDPSMLFLVMGPDHTTFTSDPNQHSVVLNVIYGESEFLFTGDAGEDQEDRLVEQYTDLLDTDFLKVGHHGSRTSSSVELLSKVTPEIAVVSLAQQNKFGHPHPEAVERLISSGTQLYYTSRDKALIFESDGKQIKRIDWE